MKSLLSLLSVLIGLTLVSPSAMADEEIDAFDFVSKVCAQSKGTSYWKDGFALEMKNIALTFSDGLKEGTIEPDGFVQRMTGNPFTEQINKIIGHPNFLTAVYYCYPDSKIKRDLLVARIIFASSVGYASGVGVGFTGGMKLFSMVTKAMGSTALPALRYFGFTENAIIRLKTMGVVTGYVVVGGMVYGSIDEAVQRYEVIDAEAQSADRNSEEITELTDLYKEIQEMLKQEKDPATVTKLESQLSTVQKLIDQRNNLYLKAQG